MLIEADPSANNAANEVANPVATAAAIGDVLQTQLPNEQISEQIGGKIDEGVDGDKLITDFFESINLRKLERCQLLLQQMEQLAQSQRAWQPWARYLHGILVFEGRNDWSQAEQVFRDLLRAELEPTLQSRVLYAIGRTAIMQARWKDAVQYYEQLGATVTQQAGPSQSQEQVKAWRQIAICYCKGFINGDFEASVLPIGVDYAKRALALLPDPAGENVAPATLWLIGSLWSTLGSLYVYLQAWDEAATCYQHDLAICQRLDDRHGLGISHLNLGEIFHKRGAESWQKALRSFQQARSIFRQFNNRYLEIDALINQGALLLDMQNLSRARNCYRRAIRLIESLRTSISAEEGRAGFFTTVVKSYGKLVKLYIEMGETKRAFDLVERARSRSFLELLANQPIRAPHQIPQPLLDEEARLLAQLQQLYAPTDEPDATGAAAERIHAVELALDNLRRQIRLIHSEYVDLRTVRPLSHRQIQRRLGVGDALLCYFVADDEIFAFVVTQTTTTVQRLPLTFKELQRAFDQRGYVIHTNPGADRRLRAPWLLQALYDRLIRPLLPDLQGVETLCLVPSGLLHFVPFHALSYRTEGGETRNLVDDYHILHAPSASVLLEYCMKKGPRLSGRPAENIAKGVLTIGYDGGNLTLAEAEATAIARLTEAGHAVVGKEATTQSLFAQAEGYRWLHFSCHGRFNPQTPLMSYLQLADTRLYVSDILHRLSLQADLVTLGACETGRNQVLNGDELMGMVRAFIYAGTPSVLVSLWPVDELSTRILMETFYRHLLQGQTKTEALRTAQQYLRTLSAPEVVTILASYGESKPEERVKQLAELTHTAQATAVQSMPAGIFAHPYFWASFILVGASE